MGGCTPRQACPVLGGCHPATPWNTLRPQDGLVQGHTVLSGEWGVLVSTLVPGTPAAERPVWATGFPQMFESMCWLPTPGPGLGQHRTLGTLCLGISVSSRVPGQTCPCPAQLAGPCTPVEG